MEREEVYTVIDQRDYEADYEEARRMADDATSNDERRTWLMIAISALTNLIGELNDELAAVPR